MLPHPFLVLEMEPRALCVMNTSSPTEMFPALKFWFFMDCYCRHWSLETQKSRKFSNKKYIHFSQLKRIQRSGGLYQAMEALIKLDDGRDWQPEESFRASFLSSSNPNVHSGESSPCAWRVWLAVVLDLAESWSRFFLLLSGWSPASPSFLSLSGPVCTVQKSHSHTRE